MARYVKELTINKPDDFVTFMMNDYLQKNQFTMSDWKGEAAYRAGDAMMEGYKYLKWSYDGSTLHLEAWMKGTFGGEWNLDGFVGCLQKKPYKESLEALFAAMQQDIQIPVDENGQPIMNAVPVKTVDNTSAATAALLFGIATFVLAFVSPIFSIIFGCLGFNQSRMGSGSSKANLAKAGKILSIVGLVIAIINWVLGIILNVAL